VEDEIFHVMTSHIVVPSPPRDILHVDDLSTIWRHFPFDMMMLMHHIVGSASLINMFRVGAHDPTTSISLAEQSTSSTPPHGPPPPSSPPHDLATTYMILFLPLHMFLNLHPHMILLLLLILLHMRHHIVLILPLLL
jgi:hypothetical protein